MTLAHDLPFDPTYGHTLDTLLQVPAPNAPNDFEAFWRDTYDQARRVPINLARRAIAPVDDQQEAFEIEYDALGGRVGGWLLVPHQPPSLGVVIGHGYGGREAPTPLHLPEPAVQIFPCAAGFHRSARPDVPGTSAFHVIHGVGSRDTYIHRFNVAELWAAFTVLQTLFPAIADRLTYSGSSFGGGLGAMMIPWEPRVGRAFLEVPSFGNHPLRLTLACTGSGQALRMHHERRGDVLAVMRYFDAATAARFITVPTMVAAALFDPAVPPPGQFAVYNALACEKRLILKQAGHFGWPGEADENRRVQQAQQQWLIGGEPI